MSEAPLAPTCRHCGATNDSGASECWLCQRQDWRETPKIRSGRSPFGPDDRSTFTGCMVYLTISLIAVVVLAFRAGRIVGLVILILNMVIFALAIALFTICMTFRVI
jgi:ribosomal protein L40E